MRFTYVGARRALVLGLVLVMRSYVTHGVRTTPYASGLADAPPSASEDQAATTFYLQERGHAAQEGESEAEEKMKNESAVTGSRLPDCTHACGPCAPCKRVLVSFRCAEAAESCPIAYRCMCRGRFFRIPTL